MSLNDDERSALKDALDAFPGNIRELPSSWVKDAFGEFSPEQQERILYEFGLFLITGAKAFYKESLTLTGVEGDVMETLGDYLGNAGAGFFKAAYDLGSKLAE